MTSLGKNLLKVYKKKPDKLRRIYHGDCQNSVIILKKKNIRTIQIIKLQSDGTGIHSLNQIQRHSFLVCHSLYRIFNHRFGIENR